MIKIKYPQNFNSIVTECLDKIKSIKFYNFKECKSSIQMFQNSLSLETVNLSQFDTSKITNMNRMFANSTLLNSIGVSEYDLNENVILDEMLCICIFLKILINHILLFKKDLEIASLCFSPPEKGGRRSFDRRC